MNYRITSLNQLSVIAALVAPFALGAAACGSSDEMPAAQRVCEPGRAVTCPCGGGEEGTQTCNGSGTAWSSCDCSASSGGAGGTGAASVGGASSGGSTQGGASVGGAAQGGAAGGGAGGSMTGGNGGTGGAFECPEGLDVDCTGQCGGNPDGCRGVSCEGVDVIIINSLPLTVLVPGGADPLCCGGATRAAPIVVQALPPFSVRVSDGWYVVQPHAVTSTDGQACFPQGVGPTCLEGAIGSDTFWVYSGDPNAAPGLIEVSRLSCAE